MAVTIPIAYSALVDGAMRGRRGWLDRANHMAEIPDAAEAGAVSLLYITGATTSTVTDGSMATDSFTTTTVPATYVDEKVTSSRPPKQARSYYTKAKNIAALGRAAANAFYEGQQNALIADLIAGTHLTNATQTLTDGQLDFHSESDAEASENLEKMARVVSLVKANFTQYNPLAEMSIVMNPTAYGNFAALRTTHGQNPQFMGDTGVWMFMGIPIFAVAGATNFEGVTNHCAFVCVKDGLVLPRELPGLFSGKPIYASDGHIKWITVGPYAHAVIDGYFGQILNGAS